MKRIPVYEDADTTIRATKQWLMVEQDGDKFRIAIGPFGLIDLGLRLCAAARGHGVDAFVYEHPEGVFSVQFWDGDLVFAEGARQAATPLCDDELLAFGLALIEAGRLLVDRPDFAGRFGGHITSSEVTE